MAMAGKQLRVIRKHLKWTQVQMAEAVGVTSNTVARWERGEVPIREPMARLILTVTAKGKRIKRR